jgi:LysM repeat protein
MAPKKPVIKKTVPKKQLGPAKVGTTSEYRALAVENAAKKNLTQTANAATSRKATNASNALKAKDVARGSATAGKAIKKVSTIGKIGKAVVSGRGILPLVGAQVALEAGKGISDYINRTASRGKAAGTSATSGRGGGAQGFIKDKPKNPIQKGTFKGPSSSSSPTKPPSSGSSGKYRVSSGDTLSGIASRAGVSLAELRAANPQLNNKGIFRNTGVNIPKSGKMPSGGYTGAVPYKAPAKQNLPYKGGATIEKKPYTGGASKVNLPYKGGTTDSQMDEKLRKKKSPKASGLE